MRIPFARCAAAALLLCSAAHARGRHHHHRAFGAACGVERWAVKTLGDPGSSQLQTRPRVAQVEELLRLPAPAYQPSNLRAGAELQTFVIEAELVSVKPEQDGDLHAVLEGTSGARLVVELPAPDCLPDSAYAARIAQARQVLEREVGPLEPHRSHHLRSPKRIRVTGVGFFDNVHGQSGGAANGFELHPVLEVEFR